MANTRNNRVKSTNDVELKDRLVAINRVTKVTKGGRRRRYSATVVVGDRKGKVGLGIGKANEVPDAIKKAISIAEKDDSVVIAGKGHENYQILKDETIHFDDKEVVEEILSNRDEV